MRSVPQSEVPQSPFLWTCGIAARETLRYLDRNGVDAEPLLLKAELSRSQLSEDSGGISVASQHRFLEFAAIETSDPLPGCTSRQRWIFVTLASFSILRRLRRRSRKLSSIWRDMRERRTKQSTSRSRSTKVRQY
jgi:hypothetical protein